ncbi:MAG TPA: hypothetical protein VFY32_01015 [Solirubrobacteraceae bacterium]|nr:hypothetical protein [Solirubrobacteraceae bacterium]
MSAPDDRDQHPRPWDPAGTQPKHDPASLLPQAGDPLLPPDADVVESDAIDEDGGDLLPERHRAAGAPAVATAGGSAYASRFQFLTGSLVAVGIAALVGVTVAIVGIPPSGGGGPPWSAWKPDAGGLEGASEIASHIAPQYRDHGKQLVKVEANDISYKGVPLLVALRKSPEDGGDIQVHDEKGVLYQMCGLGVNCQIDSGKPSNERSLLLRRAGLELALYTFRYLGDVKQVVVLIPASPGKAQTLALYFSRDALRAELDRPLTSSLLPTPPSPKTVKLSPDRRLVDQTTNRYLFSLMGSSFNQGGYLVLDPYSKAADRKLQKRLKAQQKQAAAAAAAAATATPQASGG